MTRALLVSVVLIASVASGLSTTMAQPQTPTQPGNGTDPSGQVDTPTPGGGNGSGPGNRPSGVGPPDAVADLVPPQANVSEGLIPSAGTFVGDVRGRFSRYSAWALSLFGDSTPRADLDEVERVIERNEALFRGYLNRRLDAETVESLTVIRLRFEADDTSADRYLIAPSRDGSYTEIRVQRSPRRQGQKYVVLDSGRFLLKPDTGPVKVVDSLLHDVDANVTVRGWATGLVADSLRSFVDRFGNSDENVTRSWIEETTEIYKGQVNSTLFDGEESDA